MKTGSLKRRLEPFLTEKPRQEWFYRRTSFPLRDAAPRELERFWEHQARFDRGKGPQGEKLHWEDLGPSNFAGRVTCLVVDPHHPDTVFAGSAGGGVWMSKDQGRRWESYWPKWFSQNIGALAIYPTPKSHLLVCATGEANQSPDSYPGSGVYAMQEGGPWKPYFTAPGGRPLSRAARDVLPRRVGTITYGQSPSGPRIALGAVSHDETMPAALYLDEGSLGLRPNTFGGLLLRSYNCHAVVFHPTQTGVLYAAIEPGGSMNGIWRSDDFGKHWTHLRGGLPHGEVCGRISLAISPSHPEILYALVARRFDRTVLGVFRTQNGGKTWREVGGRHFDRERQMRFNNTICVHPVNPNFVVCGGVNLHRTKDGGGKWDEITTSERGDAPPLPADFVHADHHALAIVPGKPGEDLIYSGNDGGVAVSLDSGDMWDERSRGMSTTMFYEVDVAPSNPKGKVFGGGVQDAGTLLAGVGDAAKPKEFARVAAGDGAWLVFDPADEEHVFASDAGLGVHRHRRGEPWARGTYPAKWGRTDFKLGNMQEAEKKLRAIAVMEIEPSRRKRVKKVWVGTYGLWCTENDGRSWKPASPIFDGSAISAIEISTRNPHVMFVGTTEGGIFRSIDGGKKWSENLAGLDIPPRLITRIEAHPRWPATVVVTVAGTGLAGAALAGAEQKLPYSHVFRSDDMGETWKDLDTHHRLPDVVYNALAFETHPPYRLFVGGDAGVWMATRGGGWASVAGSNLPNVVVSDLVFHKNSRTLTAATYGRGIWRLKVPKGSKGFKVRSGRPVKDDAVLAPNLRPPADGVQLRAFPRIMHLA